MSPRRALALADVVLSRGECPGPKPSRERIMRDVMGRPIGVWSGGTIPDSLDRSEDGAPARTY